MRFIYIFVPTAIVGIILAYLVYFRIQQTEPVAEPTSSIAETQSTPTGTLAANSNNGSGTPSASSAEGWATYYDDQKFHISFKYPSSWTFHHQNEMPDQYGRVFYVVRYASQSPECAEAESCPTQHEPQMRMHSNAK